MFMASCGYFILLSAFSRNDYLSMEA